MRTVVVVEDEALIRMVAAELLLDAGYHVVEFSNAADAIEFCTELSNELAAVFTDINMAGELDGLDVAQAVVIARPNAAVIVTSGRYDRKPADLAQRVTFLPKPWTSSGFLAAVARSAPL